MGSKRCFEGKLLNSVLHLLVFINFSRLPYLCRAVLWCQPWSGSSQLSSRAAENSRKCLANACLFSHTDRSWEVGVAHRCQRCLPRTALGSSHTSCFQIPLCGSQLNFGGLYPVLAAAPPPHLPFFWHVVGTHVSTYVCMHVGARALVCA